MQTIKQEKSKSSIDTDIVKMGFSFGNSRALLTAFEHCLHRGRGDWGRGGANRSCPGLFFT